MDKLHSVPRSIRSETKARRDHLSIFREFMDHLDRVTGARKAREIAAVRARTKPKKRKKPSKA